MEEKLHIELIKFQEELSKLKNAVEYIESAKHSTELAVNLIKSVTFLNNSFQKLSEKNDQLISKIDKIDFPERLSRIENSLFSLSTVLNNLQLKFELSEKNIKEQINSSIDKLNKDFNKNHIGITSQLNEFGSKVSTNRIIFIVGILLVILANIILKYI